MHSTNYKIPNPMADAPEDILTIHPTLRGNGKPRFSPWQANQKKYPKRTPSIYCCYGKRLLDITLSFFLIVLLLPLILVIAVSIALTSRGGILIIQPRIGFKSHTFAFWKFRTMYVEQNDVIAEHAIQLAERGILLKIKQDPRVTPFGGFLRKYSLDELPQLINILRGDMSFVGPRPLLPFMVEPYPVENRSRAVVRPGLTGLWQVQARNLSNSVLQMITYDLDYIRKISLAKDLKILMLTIPAILSGKGAK